MSSEKKENIQTVKLYFLVLSFTAHTVIDTESFQNGWVVLAVCMLGHTNLDDNSAYRKFLIESATGRNGCAQSPVEEAVVEKNKENTRSTWMFYFVDSWYFLPREFTILKSSHVGWGSHVFEMVFNLIIVSNELKPPVVRVLSVAHLNSWSNFQPVILVYGSDTRMSQGNSYING